MKKKRNRPVPSHHLSWRCSFWSAPKSTPGGIRTHGLPLRSFCWACALAFVWDRLSLVVQGWRAIYCSSEFAFFHLKSPEKGVSCLQDVCKSNKGGRTLRPIYRFLLEIHSFRSTSILHKCRCFISCVNNPCEWGKMKRLTNIDWIIFRTWKTHMTINGNGFFVFNIFKVFWQQVNALSAVPSK